MCEYPDSFSNWTRTLDSKNLKNLLVGTNAKIKFCKKILNILKKKLNFFLFNNHFVIVILLIIRPLKYKYLIWGKPQHFLNLFDHPIIEILVY